MTNFATSSDRRWLQAFVTLCLGLGLLLTLFWDTAEAMVRTWFVSDTYNYGFLILPVCTIVAWQRRQIVTQEAPTPSFWGFAAASFGAIVWLIGEFATATVVQQLALIGMMQGITLSIIGLRAARVLAFPLLYLYLSVPMGGFLIPRLQTLTAYAVTGLLREFNTAAYLDGVIIHTAAGQFQIAQACAGARFLFAAMALGILAAYYLFQSWWKRILFLCLAALVPIFANGLRAYALIMIAHNVGFDLAQRIDHITFGFIFLTFVIIIILGIGVCFRDRAPASSPSCARNVNTSPKETRSNFPRSAFVAAITLSTIFSIVWFGLRPMDHSTAVKEIGFTPNLPIDPQWALVHGSEKDWRPMAVGADEELLRSYSDGTRTIDLFIAYYRQQEQGAEIINEQNRIAGTSGWTIISKGMAQVLIDDKALSVQTVYLSDRGAGRLVWYWYWVNGDFTGSPMIAKLRQIEVKLFNGIHSAAIIAISSRVIDDNVAETQLIQRRFLRDVGPLDTWLRSVGLSASWASHITSVWLLEK